MVTYHDSCFVLGSLEVLLGQFKIKIEADLILVQLRKLSPKITRPLQSARVSVGNDTYGITRIPTMVAGRGVVRRAGLAIGTRIVYPGSGREDA